MDDPSIEGTQYAPTEVRANVKVLAHTNTFMQMLMHSLLGSRRYDGVWHLILEISHLMLNTLLNASRR